MASTPASCRARRRSTVTARRMRRRASLHAPHLAPRRHRHEQDDRGEPESPLRSVAERGTIDGLHAEVRPHRRHHGEAQENRTAKRRQRHDRQVEGSQQAGAAGEELRGGHERDAQRDPHDVPPHAASAHRAARGRAPHECHVHAQVPGGHCPQRPAAARGRSDEEDRQQESRRLEDSTIARHGSRPREDPAQRPDDACQRGARGALGLYSVVHLCTPVWSAPHRTSMTHRYPAGRPRPRLLRSRGWNFRLRGATSGPAGWTSS